VLGEVFANSSSAANPLELAQRITNKDEFPATFIVSSHFRVSMSLMKTASELTSPRRLFNRRSFLSLGVTSAAACVADAFLFGPEDLTVTRRDVVCHGLPPALDGLKICMMADFHFRPGQDDELLAKTVACTNAEKPDLIALPGDFADSDHSVLTPLVRELAKLRATHGVFASMGNHDGWNAGRETTRSHFEKAGISFLINRNSQVTIRNESLAVAGTDFVWTGRPDPAQTFKGIPKDRPVVALVHEPDYFDTMTAHRNLMLQLSGHTHGGQCKVPVAGYAPVRVAFGRKYVEGLFSRGNSRLYVTRGVGTTSLRVRFACPPEIAVLSLRSIVSD
jgi:predicted MPP superfamily phosphohydrolase